jgi:hypothetical protein
VPLGEGRNIWGVSDVVQKLFNGGLLGAIIATVLASLIWRVLASEYPLFFLRSPFAKPVMNMCFLAECSGIINISWPLSSLHRKITGVRPDEYYLGHHHHQPKTGDSRHRDVSTHSLTDSHETPEYPKDEELAL